MFTSQPSTSDCYSVNWTNQQNHVLEGLKCLLAQDDLLLTDVTLACDGEFIQAHKLVLCLCSVFFRDLFTKNKIDKSNVIIVLGQLSGQNLRHLLNFMYQGNVEVPMKDMDSFLEAGKMLKVEGLVEATMESRNKAVRNIQVNHSVPSEPRTSALCESICHATPASFPVITSTSGICDVIPRKESMLSDAVTLNESIPTMSNSANFGQGFEPSRNLKDMLGESEHDECDHVDDDQSTEEAIDFNLMITGPIQVYSGFTNTNQSDPMKKNNAEEAFRDTLSPIAIESRTDDTGLLAKTSVSTNREPYEPGSNPEEQSSYIGEYFEQLDCVPHAVRCKICSKRIAKLPSGTYAFRRHLKSVHFNEFETMTNQKKTVKNQKPYIRKYKKQWRPDTLIDPPDEVS